MTDEQTNTAIAEALGYVVVCGQLCCTHTTPRGEPEPLPVGDGSVPNYTEDLNAMHEAEKKAILCPEPYEMVYHQELMDICNKTNRVKVHEDYSSFLTCLHATAVQRAEAFLRTLGLWED